MRLPSRPFAAAACTLSLALSAFGQQPAQAPKSKTTTTTRPAVVVDPLAAQRRNTAINLVNSLADEARSFHDSTLRARVQTEAADALWETDQERARSLFRRAWDAAEQADEENRKKAEEDRNALPTATPGGNGGGQRTAEVTRMAQAARPGALAALLNRPNVRSEVLRAAAKRDRALGEEFLTKLDEARKQDEHDLNAESVASAASGADAGGGAGANSPAMPATITPREASPEDERRLQLAIELMQENDTERALQFAGPALTKVNSTVVEFLVDLREKNADAADQRFGALLTRAYADASTDPNAVLLLSSYVLTPHMYMELGQGGRMSTSQRSDDTSPPANMAAAVRQGFAQFAAQELLRPLPPANPQDGNSARSAAYFVIGRLLPFFDQTLPAVAPNLRAQMAAVMPDMNEQQRTRMDNNMTRGLVPESQRPDGLQQALDTAQKANDPDVRDRAYMQAALISSRKGDAKARDYASKIENADLREQVYAFVDFTAVEQAVRKKDGLEVLRLAREGDLNNTQRTWAYTEAAKLLKDDRAHAIEALEAAFQTARKIDADDPDRPRSLVAVATQFVSVDRPRAWELMPEIVKAANAATEFTGTDAAMAARVRTGNMMSTTNFSAPDFDLKGVFRSLAKDDMNRAVALAQTFTNEAPRAVATLAVARAVLEEKPAPTRPARASN